MRRETDPIKPLSEQFFRSPSLGWWTCVSPPEMTLYAWGALEEHPRLCEWP